MSFWLKVRSAIRAGDEMLPPVSGVIDPPATMPEVAVVKTIPEPVLAKDMVGTLILPSGTPSGDPQNTAMQAEKDAVRYIEQVRPLAILIGRTEGTSKARGYDETLGYGAYDPKGYPPITMQGLAQLDKFQTAMLSHPKNKLNSSAVGMYQYIRTTLRALVKKWGFKPEQLFDRTFQDDLLYITLVGRGLVRWRKGEITEDAFINNLSAEWASLPNTKGKGTYAGQHTGCTVAELRAVLAQIK
jgi:hypothetical protein